MNLNDKVDNLCENSWSVKVGVVIFQHDLVQLSL